LLFLKPIIHTVMKRDDFQGSPARPLKIKLPQMQTKFFFNASSPPLQFIANKNGEIELSKIQELKLLYNTNNRKCTSFKFKASFLWCPISIEKVKF